MAAGSDRSGGGKGRESTEDSPDPNAALAALSFEKILERLQKIVERLEGGELALEDSLRAFEEGVRLSKAGQKRLDDAERRIEVLLKDESGAARTTPLDVESAEPEPPEARDAPGDPDDDIPF